VSDGADWPPDVIFDAAYGIAALKAWGTPTFLEFIRNSTWAMYNDEEAAGDENGGDDDTNEANRGQRPPEDGRKAHAEGSKFNAKQCPDFHDMVLGRRSA
jgi:hypothetical protein